MIRRKSLILLVLTITVVITCLVYSRYPIRIINHSHKIDKIFVINMERSKERMKRVSEQFNSINLPFTRFEAVDGYKVLITNKSSGESITGLGLKNNNSFFTEGGAYDVSYDNTTIEYIAKNRNIPNLQPYLSSGEFGVFLSHYFLWKEIVKKDYDSIVIFEDDLILNVNFEKRLQDIIKNAPSEFDILYISPIIMTEYEKKCCTMDFLTKKVSFRLSEDYNLWKIKGIAAYAAGYIISNKGAKLLLQNTSQFSMPVDVEMSSYYKNKISAYYIEPHLSELDTETSANSEIWKMGR